MSIQDWRFPKTDPLGRIMIDRSEITGLVLCGGGGRRMGGVDKPLVNLNDQPIVSWVLERVMPQVSEVLICCNRNREIYESYGATCIDDLPGQFGPLAGIHAGLSRCNTDYAFVCPGDTPLLSLHIVRALAEALERSERPAAMAHDGIQPQPLFLLLRCTAAMPIEQYLRSGKRKVLGWAETMRPAIVDFTEDADSFTNVNTRHELKRVERQLRSYHPQD